MNIIKKFIGPKSKYDKSIPYTYLAKVPRFEGDNEIFFHYFSDTICGLVEYLEQNDIAPEDVQIFGLFRKKEIPLEKKYCTTSDGKWLDRPEICHSLEQHYSECLEDRYKGHVEDGECSFEDRDRKGEGPF